MLSSENVSTLQPHTKKPSALNPCWCEQCTMLDHNHTRVQRPGFSHWWCDTCGKGPFDRKAGQRPVYQRNVLVDNAITSIRYACSGACAQSEQMNKLRDAKAVKMQAGELDLAKQITLEIDAMSKGPEKPTRKPE